jgi:hypothetical protein
MDVLNDSGEAQLTIVGRIEADHPSRRRDQLVHDRALTLLCPVRARDERMHGCPVDPVRIVVENEPAGEEVLHGDHTAHR